jgi:quinol monooxygenase YgiN
MYELINRFTAVPGKRDELASCMLQDVGLLPGCRSFVVARDPKDPDAP